MTDKSVIAYSSVWPLARRAIIGICFPPIPWPMTQTCQPYRICLLFGTCKIFRPWRSCQTAYLRYLMLLRSNKKGNWEGSFWVVNTEFTKSDPSGIGHQRKKDRNVGIIIHIVLRKVAENNHSSCAQKDAH
jgi:hypothetical protein